MRKGSEAVKYDVGKYHLDTIKSAGSPSDYETDKKGLENLTDLF